MNRPSRARGSIASLADLRRHLQWAIELEHATLPPYLCALYSLDAEKNKDAVQVISSVFVEEMLHLTLAANLLNAVGGSPVLDAPHLLPAYPTTLPHGDRSIEISLLPFGPEAIETFLAIERPSARDASPEGEDYQTIGQFYEAIELGLSELCNTLGEEHVFVGDPARQITAGFRYGGSGRLVPVYDLPSALDALAEIVEQGEGIAHDDVWDGDQQMFDPDREEVAHYFRFLELKLGRRYRRGDTPQSGPTGDVVTVDWAGVRPMRPNPSTRQHPSGSAIRLAQEQFNRTYSTLLHLLEHAFNGSPRLLSVATGQMFALKAQAQDLMRLPTEDGTTVAGPTFEYVKPSDRHWSTGQDRRVSVLPDGPYVVHGEVPLRRKRKVVSADGNSVTWELDGTIETEAVYALCRCGRSGAKPFCDGSHAVTGFDGTETADPRPYDEQSWQKDGVGLSLRRVNALCMHAAFCIGRERSIAKMIHDSEDSDVRALIAAQVDRCPSGSFTYALAVDGPVNEADLPTAISVIEEEDDLASGLWVTGRIPVDRSDGVVWEARNRTMLCRCGHSANKPLCDGTHRAIRFREP